MSAVNVMQTERRLKYMYDDITFQVMKYSVNIINVGRITKVAQHNLTVSALLLFLSDPGIPGVRSMGPSVSK